MRHVCVVACVLLAVLAVAAPAVAAPEGQLTWGVHISLAPTWFDPAETQGLITPFMVLYAVHDAMAKAMPGSTAAPSLAESWQVSPDGRVYDFTLRKGVKFHNGDLLTSEDVTFSFDRYRGASAKTLKERVAAVETPDPLHVRFRLKNPWPDFMTFYTAASGAGWIVPRKYVEKVGDDGYKKAPSGAGPYKCVSCTPGGEPRRRPQVDQRGDHARPLAADLQHHPEHVRLLLAAPVVSLRSGTGQEAPGRGRLPQRVRRRRLLRGRLLLERARGGRELPAADRHPRQADRTRARIALEHLRRQEVQEPRLHGERRVRQRGHPAGVLRGERRHVRV